MVTNNGVTIMLSHPVNYTHHGVTESFTGGHSIDIRYNVVITSHDITVWSHMYRAEVGLLSHNVLVHHWPTIRLYLSGWVYWSKAL